MTKLTTVQWLLLFLIIALSIMFGEWVGVRDYKLSCEPMSNNKYAVQWLECAK